MSKQDDEYTISVAEWQHQARKYSIREQGPTTVCYAVLCRYAEACPSRSLRPKRLLQSKCPRYWPEDVRPQATLSSHILAMLNRSV